MSTDKVVGKSDVKKSKKAILPVVPTETEVNKTTLRRPAKTKEDTQLEKSLIIMKNNQDKIITLIDELSNTIENNVSVATDELTEKLTIPETNFIKFDNNSLIASPVNESSRRDILRVSRIKRSLSHHKMPTDDMTVLATANFIMSSPYNFPTVYSRLLPRRYEQCQINESIKTMVSTFNSFKNLPEDDVYEESTKQDENT